MAADSDPRNSSRTLLTTERFRVDEVTRTLPAGGTRVRAVVRHPGAVAILPLVDAEHVCLIKNYRVSVNRVLLEIPAGTLEAGESPLATAKRELQEETGYRSDSLEQFTSFYLSPGILDEQMHLFVARDLTPGSAARELGEEIENWIVPWEEAIQLAVTGQIIDAKTIAALLLYDRIRGQTSPPQAD